MNMTTVATRKYQTNSDQGAFLEVFHFIETSYQSGIVHHHKKQQVQAGKLFRTFGMRKVWLSPQDSGRNTVETSWNLVTVTAR